MNLVPDLKKLCTAGAFFLLAALFAAEPADFPFYKDIDIPAKQTSGVSILDFTIDAEMYLELKDPNGLRIFAPDGSSCPFTYEWVMEQDAARTVQRRVNTSTRQFETLPDGSVRITVSANGNGDPVTGLAISTPAKDFDKKVKVFASDGTTLIAEGAFLDYSSRIDLRNDYIAFPEPVQSGDFVVVIENYTEIKDSPLSRVVQGDMNTTELYKVREEPKITGITLTCLGKSYELEKAETETPITILDRKLVKQPHGPSTTVVKFSNGFAPLGKLTVHSSDAFFSRPYRLYDDSGKLVSNGTVRHLESGFYRTSESARMINVGDRRTPSWTIEFDNGEYGELKDLTLTATGPVMRVRFLSGSPSSAASSATAIRDSETIETPEASGEQAFSSYRVYYGATGMPAPDNPFADMMRQNSTGTERAVCTLSPQHANPVFRTTSGAVRDWSVVYRILMGVAALAVMLILIRSVGHVEKIKD